MIDRCRNNKSKLYEYYGLRGIFVCDEWLNKSDSFVEWALSNGYKVGLEIDRRDNDGEYSPNNCRFVTHKTNMYNQRLLRKSNTSGYRGISFYNDRAKYVARITHNGVAKTLCYYKNIVDSVICRDAYIIKYGLQDRLNLTKFEKVGG